MEMGPAAEALNTNAVIGFIGIAFWVLVGVAILVRVVVAIFRRRPREIQRGVVAPFFSAGAAQSEAYGWKPALEEQSPTSVDTTTSSESIGRADPGR